jgi:hypothetical protein
LYGKRSEEGRGDGIVADDEGKGGRRRAKGGMPFSLSHSTHADGVVYRSVYRHLLLYPLLLRSPICLPKLACSPCFASVHQPQRQRYDCSPLRVIQPNTCWEVASIVVFILISHAYAHHDVLNMQPFDFASHFSSAALPDTHIMTLSHSRPFSLSFQRTTPTGSPVACMHVYIHVPIYLPPDHATSLRRNRSCLRLSIARAVMTRLIRQFPPLRLALSRFPVAVQF